MTGMLPDEAYVPGTGPQDRAATDVVFCERCCEQIDHANECASVGIDVDRPRCTGCCECEDCAGNQYSAHFDPSTRVA